MVFDPSPILRTGMQAWQIALAAALPAAAISVSLAVCVVWLLRYGHSKNKHSTSPRGDTSEKVSFWRKKIRTCPGVLRSRNARDPLDSSFKQSNRVASVWRATYPVKAFNWSAHPTLVAEAVEHGWATFAFSYTHFATPIPPKLWDLCTGCSQIEPCEPEISWEVGAGTDYMQRMRLNPGISSKKVSEVTTVQALQTSLPLPGPPLGPLSFPQEAYFEVTILAESQEYMSRSSFNENEHAKLISPRLSAAKGLSSDARLVYGNDSYEKREAVGSNGAEEEARKSSEQEEDDATSMQAQASELGKKDLDCGGLISAASQQQVCAVGLAAGEAPPFRLPGCDPGSVGFLSTGQVFLNGEEASRSSPSSGRRSWGSINTTVGCGFDPAARKIFFTLNGDNVLEMSAPIDLGEQFDHPLFPTVAANYDITLSANFGQTPFDYGPANNSRIPDPCFRRPPPKAAHYPGGLEDSADLFSMGRINSQWLADLAPSPSRSPGPQPQPQQQLQPSHPTICETEAESDLFEIVLDSRTNS